jgi:ferritin
MLSNTINTLINQQITKEFFSAYMYLDIANYFEDNGLTGFSSWFKIQAQEELDHGMKFYQYLHDNNEKIILEKISAPNQHFDSLGDALKESLKHEEYVTSSINKIYEEATNEKDYRTLEFLNWFIKEQAEEEKSAQELITKMELTDHNNRGIYLLDRELSKRTYRPA